MKSHEQRPTSLSVVVPCFNEEAVIQKMHGRLSLALAGTGLNYEIIYVNDGSRDNTLAILRQVQVGDHHVRIVSFARNFGHQMAVTAGVDFAAGDAVVLIDADLQDPPELIQEMVRLWRNGAKVVYGVRESARTNRHLSFFPQNTFIASLTWSQKLRSHLTRAIFG